MSLREQIAILQNEKEFWQQEKNQNFSELNQSLLKKKEVLK